MATHGMQLSGSTWSWFWRTSIKYMAQDFKHVSNVIALIQADIYLAVQWYEVENKIIINSNRQENVSMQLVSKVAEVVQLLKKTLSLLESSQIVLLGWQSQLEKL